MWLLRSWIFLLTLALAAAFGAALVGPRPPTNDLVKAHSYKLDLVQHNAQMLLRLDARALLETTSQMSRDSRIAELLEQAGAKQKGADALQAKADAIAMQLLEQIPAPARPELCVLVDYRGKQISRIDPEHTKFVAGKDGLAGYPVVAAALRGFLRDDTWSINGRLYMVGAVPVVSRARNRYVGALVLGQEVDKDYAAQLKKRLLASDVPFLSKIELAFFLRGKLLSGTLDSKRIRALPRDFRKGKDSIVKVGRSAAFAIRDGARRRIVVMAPLPGAVTAHGAFYALLSPAPPPPTLFGTLKRLRGSDFTTGIWLLVAGLFVIVLVVSLLVAQMEAAGPVNKLLDDVRRLHRGEISTIADHKHAVRTREIAKLVNELVDKASEKKPESRDIDRIFADRGREAEPSHPSVAEGGVALGGSMPPLAADEPPSTAAIASAGVELDGGSFGVAPLSSLDEEEAPTLQAQGPTMPAYGEQMLEMPELAPMGGDDDNGGGGLSLPPGLGFDDDEPPAPALHVKVTTSGGGKASSMPPIGDAEPLSIPELAPLDEAEAMDDPDAYFREVYQEFVKIKQSCGESTDKLSYERFAIKLRKNRDSLMERYECRDVKFRVYIKDGKAALKATPLTD